MEWKEINANHQLDEIISESTKQPVMIFKHSTRCSISGMAKFRLERSWDKNAEIAPYFLDLISHREISNSIAEKFNVAHQSPQVILLNNGEVVYHDSHMSISFGAVQRALKN